MSNIYPYNDDYMIFNANSNRYELTEEAFIDAGINIRARLETNSSLDANIIIKQIIRRVSELIYGYIHSFGNSQVKDRLIATTPSLRPIIYDALRQQLLYYLHEGDLSHSPDVRLRELAIDESAKDSLLSYVPEINNTILFAG